MIYLKHIRLSIKQRCNHLIIKKLDGRSSVSIQYLSYLLSFQCFIPSLLGSSTLDGGVFIKKYIISFVEDNDLGIYTKEIIVEANSILQCVQVYSTEYPTLYGAKEVFGPILDDWKNYYTHQFQDALQKSKLTKNVELEA